MLITTELFRTFYYTFIFYVNNEKEGRMENEGGRMKNVTQTFMSVYKSQARMPVLHYLHRQECLCYITPFLHTQSPFHILGYSTTLLLEYKIP